MDITIEINKQLHKSFKSWKLYYMKNAVQIGTITFLTLIRTNADKS